MSLLDRIRRRLNPGAVAAGWDDAPDDSLVAQVTSLASAWDAEPDDPCLAATRAAALGAFATASSGPVEPLPDAAGRALPAAAAAPGIRRGGLRPALILVATALLLAVSLGTVAASVPGGPLYDARVASEDFLLPGAPDPRAQAQVERLDGRVTEASAAVVRGDGNAVIASLRAYARIAVQAAAEPPAEAATAAQLAFRVHAQLELISRIHVGDVGVDRERIKAQGAARALLAALGAPADGPGPIPASTGAPSPDGTVGPGGPNPSGGPAQSSSPNVPDASAGPGGTGGPGVSPSPSGVPGPNRTTAPSPPTTPRGSANPDPAPGGGGTSPGSSGGSGGATQQPGGGSSQPVLAPGASTPPGRP